MRLSAGARAHQRWLLVEGLWAGAFPAPSYRELVMECEGVAVVYCDAFRGTVLASVGRATKNSQASKPVSNSQLKRPWYQASTALATTIRHFFVALAPGVDRSFPARSLR